MHTRYREVGGEDVVVEAERTALRQAHHEVHQHIEENPAGSVAAAASLAASLWNVRSARRVSAVVEQLRPDIAHVHNTWFALSPSVVTALRRHRVPVVMTVHNYRLACVNALFLRAGAPCEKCLDHSPLQAVRHRCYRGSRATSAVAAAGISLHRGLRTWARGVDRFIVLSEFARERLVRSGLPAHRLVPGSNFVTDPGPRRSAPSASREVLFIGRVSPEKGLAVLLDAWRTTNPNGLRLVVIGDGPVRAQLQASAPADVEFTGRLPAEQVRDRLHRARALVIPSIWYEGQPMTALEGLAAGTPLVVSDIGGLPEVLGSAGGAGWTTAPGRPDELGHTVRGLLDDAAVDARGARARARYLANFTPSAAVQRLEAVYADAQNGRSP